MIIFSEDIMLLNDMMKAMTYAIITVSVVIVFVTGWLVHYMNNFMLHRRSKELGTYMTLGIGNKAITKLFLIENALIGGISLAIGIIAGSFIFEILTLIIMHIFNAVYEVRISFSMNALVLTVLYILLIYAFSMIRTRIKLRKLRIYDLLYAEKKNETARLNNGKGCRLIFIVSILFGLIGALLLHNTFSNGDNVTVGRIGVIFLCFTICIYGFYISLSFILVSAFINNKAVKYKSNNLFLFRNLSSKMNTMSITLGTLGMLLTITMTAVSIGMLFKGFFEDRVNSITNFDISITSPAADEDFKAYKQYIYNNFTVVNERVYNIYETNTKKIYDILSHTSLGGTYWEDDPVMKFSDYQQLRNMLGYNNVDLQQGKFLLQCTLGVKEVIEKEKAFSLTFGGETLKYQESLLEDFSLEGINGAYYVIVVPDNIAEHMNVKQRIYVVDTKEETTADNYKELGAYVSPVKRNDGSVLITSGNIEVKGAILAENRSSFTIMSFSLFYLGLIFMCVAATILTVQMLSETVKYKARYGILSNLGMGKLKIEGIIIKQFIFYFGFPILLPIPISALVTVSINRLFEGLLSKSILMTSLFMSIGLFLFVYALYFVFTYITYRKSIFNENS